MSRSPSPDASQLTSPVTSITDTSIESDVGDDSGSEKEEIFKCLQPNNSIHLIDERYKKIEAELNKSYEESVIEFMKSFPIMPREEVTMQPANELTEKRDSLYEDAITTFVVCAFVVSISLLGFYARCLIESSMLPTQILEFGKFWSPYLCSFVGFVLIKDLMRRYF